MKLEPCPFCGHDLNQQDLWHETIYPVDRVRSIWAVNCAEEVGGCGANILGYNSDEAVAKWNTRVK